MDFTFDSDTLALSAAVADFARDRLAPHYQADDRAGRMRPGLRAEMAAVGLLGLAVPESYGGQGATAVATGVAIEQVARADFNASYLVLLTVLNAEVIAGTVPAERESAWLGEIASGRALPCLALTEPAHGSDAAHVELRAERVGDGWLLNGEKTSVSLGMYADTAVVFARTGGDGAAGVSAFYVDLDERVSRSPFTDLGSHAIGRASLHFDDVVVPAERLLGEEGQGFRYVMRGFDYSRALIGLMCLGAAQASVDEALAWAGQREAFGVPIGRFQGVAFPLVEHATYLRAARLLCYEALALRDAGADAGVPANMAKWWAPAAAVAAAHQALLTFGQLGYSEELPLAQRLRDIIGLEIGDGTAQIAKLVVARRLLGRAAAP